MAPILIDHRGLLKIGIISTLTIAFIFVSGFLIGYQRAISLSLPGSETATLPLPKEVTVTLADIEPRIPEVMVAGEDIDVDHPEVNDKITTNEPEHLASGNILKNTLNPVFTEEPLTVTADIKMENDTGVYENDIDTSLSGSDLDNAEISQQVSAMQSFALESVELQKIKYTIQVGIYGRLANAENMSASLQAKHLNAYVSEYLNRKNEVLYNVRFGYFIDKKTAATALVEYKNNQQGDGYIVKFSTKGIANVAAVEVKQQLPLNEEAGQAASSGMLQENISQLEIQDATSSLSADPKNIITN